MWAVLCLQGIKGDTGPAGAAGAKGDQVRITHNTIMWLLETNLTHIHMLLLFLKGFPGPPGFPGSPVCKYFASSMAVILVFGIVEVTLHVTVRVCRVHQVLLAKLEGTAPPGSKVKKWVQITHVAISDLHSNCSFPALKITTFKGQWWCSRLSGTNRTAGLARLTRADGICMFLHIIYAWPIPTYLWTVHSIAFSVFAMKGSTWYWGIGWKRWETRAAGELHACSALPTHWGDAIVQYSLRYAYIIIDLCRWLLFRYQGEAGPPGPAGPRGIPVSITSHIYMNWFDSLYIQCRIQHELGVRSILCLSRTVNSIQIQLDMQNNVYIYPFDVVLF